MLFAMTHGRSEEGPTITKVIRHHKFPRSRKFIPSEADSTPINPFLFLDKRVTIMQGLGKRGERIEVRDEWKRRGNNLDKKRERWIGKTIFYVPTRSAKQSEVAGHHNACVAICSDALRTFDDPFE